MNNKNPLTPNLTFHFGESSFHIRNSFNFLPDDIVTFLLQTNLTNWCMYYFQSPKIQACVSYQ